MLTLHTVHIMGMLSRVGQLAAHVRGQDVRRQIAGEVVPRSGRQDHEIGVFPFREAAHGVVQEAGVGSRYGMPVLVRQS
jgi:hypothetical protein